MPPGDPVRRQFEEINLQPGKDISYIHNGVPPRIIDRYLRALVALRAMESAGNSMEWDLKRDSIAYLREYIKGEQE